MFLHYLSSDVLPMEAVVQKRLSTEMNSVVELGVLGSAKR